MKLSDYIAKFLAKQNIPNVYVFTGGAIAHLIDSFYLQSQKSNKVKPISVMHEQSGSMAIDGYSRITGKLGVAIATSGPGGTNFITGIACSYYDSIPGLYFTGQVRTWEVKGESKQRQVGFQETDIISLVKPITKYAVMITNPKSIRYELEKAIYIATHDRPGPVLIDLPMDMQWAEINPKNLKGFTPPKQQDDHKDLSKKIKTIINWLKEAKRPMIICGRGVRTAKAINEIKKLSFLTKIPIAVTFGGKDIIPHDYPYLAGLMGIAGNHSANSALDKSDLVLAIGTRLAWRQIKAKPNDFLPKAKLVHVEIDSSEINQRVKVDIDCPYDAKIFLQQLLKERDILSKLDISQWSKKVRKDYLDHPFCKPQYFNQKKVNPYVFLKTLSDQMGENDIVAADAGNNMMWTMQTLVIRGNQRIFTAHAHSPMGYSLPAAMGPAAIYKNSKTNVICTIGDGGMQLNIQELQTIAHYRLPVKIFILNNHAYGAIVDFQTAQLNNRYYASSTMHGYSVPDFMAISKAFEIKAVEINSQENLAIQIKHVLNFKGPIVCNVNLMPKTFVSFDL